MFDGVSRVFKRDPEGDIIGMEHHRFACTTKDCNPSEYDWKRFILVFGDDERRACVDTQHSLFIMNNQGKTIDLFH
jgi:hypothetical protein